MQKHQLNRTNTRLFQNTEQIRSLQKRKCTSSTPKDFHGHARLSISCTFSPVNTWAWLAQWCKNPKSCTNGCLFSPACVAPTCTANLSSSVCFGNFFRVPSPWWGEGNPSDGEPRWETERAGLHWGGARRGCQQSLGETQAVPWVPLCRRQGHFSFLLILFQKYPV